MKFLKYLILMLFTVTALNLCVCAQDDTIVMQIDNTVASKFGETVTNDVAPIISENRTMLPARFVAEALGATVGWNEQEQKVTISKENKTILLTVGSNVAYINGKPAILDSTVFIQNSRTYTPVRFIAEKLGASVEWKNESRQVVINKNGYVADATTYYQDINSPETTAKQHSVIIPKLLGESAAAKAVNDKIFNKHGDSIDLLKSGETPNTIYQISYDYLVYNGIVGIFIKDSRSQMGSFWNNAYYGYYFDTRNQKELSFPEYISALNIDYKTMVDSINADIGPFEQYGTYVTISNKESDGQISAAILDETTTIAAYVTNGWGMEKIECGSSFGK